MLKKAAIIFLCFGILFPINTLARIGVGIGTGKIEVNENLKPGGIYTLPPITVLNTGDEASEYGLSIEYHQDQPQLSPSREWFVFSPSSFNLEPGESKIVEIKLNLPVKIEPGNYFAYLEAHPVKKSRNTGGAMVGIASAAKLYFSVSPANIWQGIYYKAVSFWKVYAPWPSVASIAIAILLLIFIFRKFFSFQIGIRRKNENPEIK
ncbi:MAG: hypothetical protein ABIC19_01645 [Patescibacteria group bacterium]|nr:hypothetical protein [Patescibacteria group bacterium]